MDRLFPFIIYSNGEWIFFKRFDSLGLIGAARDVFLEWQVVVQPDKQKPMTIKISRYNDFMTTSF
jgi:hypothetical protein